MARSVSQPAWLEWDPSRSLPPIDSGLTGWEIQSRRKSHWNARRLEGGKTHFLKWFFHGPWANPARREWRNARLVSVLGIPTVLAAGWGRHDQGTFIVLEGSAGLPAEAWLRRGATPEALLHHAMDLAALAVSLHDAGLCHRDLNVYHVLVSEEGMRLIDVGRIARFTRRRWIVKDLASLLASARREGFPASAARSFLRRYLELTCRPWSRRSLLRAVLAKAERYRRHNEKR